MWWIVVLVFLFIIWFIYKAIFAESSECFPFGCGVYLASCLIVILFFCLIALVIYLIAYCFDLLKYVDILWQYVVGLI